MRGAGDFGGRRGTAGASGAMRRLLAVAAICAGLAGLGAPAHAEDEIGNNMLVEADELIYDRDNRVVTARGNVEITSDQRVLLADEVVYDRKSDTVTAIGNVTLLQPDGEVMFADEAVLSEDLRDGVAEAVRMLLEKNARLAARSGTRTAANVTELNRAVYSPCDVCKEDPTRSPLWQIKSYKVIHNKQALRVEYEDALIEFFGVPVFYTPYFSHPDPAVKRQSGFLMPSVTVSEDFGTVVRAPFFWNLAPNYDLTLKPRFQSQAGTVYAAEWRHNVGFGEYSIDASATWPKEDTRGGSDIEPFRGHLFTKGKFTLSPTFDYGFDVKLTTDETYLRRYNIYGENDLISNVYLRGLSGRNYMRADAFYFQGLLESDDQASIPYIAPLVEYSYYLEPKIAGGQVTVNLNALNLDRQEGTSFQRFSADAGWDWEHTALTGEQYRLFANLRGDVYVIDNDINNGVGREDESVETRILPMIGAEYSWPWVRRSGSVSQVIEPIVQAIYTPPNANPDVIPNDDSINVDFDDTLLFDENRYPGLDRYEDGSRVNYGLKWSFFGDNGGKASLLLGQSYRFQENDKFDASSGLRDQMSDVVGRLEINPGQYLDLTSRFRVDAEDGKLLRNEVIARSYFELFEKRAFSTEVNYVYLDESLDVVDGEEGHEVAGNMSYQFLDNWWVWGNARRDLQRNAMVSDGVGLTYRDECFLFTLGFNQSFTRDRDIEPSTSVSFFIQLATLGEAGASTSLGSAEN